MRMEIPKTSELTEKVFSIQNDEDFSQIALDVFRFQYYNNPVYKQFCNVIDRTPQKVAAWEQIPFLPISLFKTHPVVTFEGEPEIIFKSSGTTGSATSSHFVKQTTIYQKSFLLAFERFYGKAEDYCILGLLPSYLERGDSSLVFMVKELIERSGHPQSGFYLYEHEQLADVLAGLEAKGQRTLLIGVTYALLDFAKENQLELKNTIIMETGGMKGRGKEMVRSEVHQLIKDAFSVTSVHSEYGMTELLSQAYAKEEGRFSTPPWMKVMIRDETDPLSCIYPKDQPVSGAINVIDLANIYSCSFIATEDMGRLYPDGSFEVLGRMDNSDVRGCSLMTV
jgi:phenylacetate-coenzyme A ligase PaaK-like adenylate-forming protein